MKGTTFGEACSGASLRFHGPRGSHPPPPLPHLAPPTTRDLTEVPGYTDLTLTVRGAPSWEFYLYDLV